MYIEIYVYITYDIFADVLNALTHQQIYRF